MPLLSALASVLLTLPSPNAPVNDEPPEVQVPFGCGLVFPVSQGHDTGSHTYNDVWAWDFRMPEGVPIVAAADGVVRLARGDSSIGGCDPSFAPHANYVVVTHPNGYETQYLHFRQVVVKSGDRVKAGELLGYAGKTGWACGSHLHFKVARPEGNGWNNPSVPARIAGYGDPDVDVVIAAPACKRPSLPIQMAQEQGDASIAPVPAVSSTPAPSAAPSSSTKVEPPARPATGATPAPQPISRSPAQIPQARTVTAT